MCILIVNVRSGKKNGAEQIHESSHLVIDDRHDLLETKKRGISKIKGYIVTNYCHPQTIDISHFICIETISEHINSITYFQY